MSDLRAFIESECEGTEFKHEARWIEEFVVSKKQPTVSSAKTELKFQDGRFQLAYEMIQRRKLGEPLAYIFGSWAFREFEFFCGSGVLIPRPETEELVDIVVGHVDCEMVAKKELQLVDFGAGTGCLGIATAIELRKKFPNLKIKVTFVEKSPAAFFYLKKNVERYLSCTPFIEVLTLCEDWNEWANRQDRFDVLVSNPPYLCETEFLAIDDGVKNFEPREALVPSGDPTGVVSYFELLKLGAAADAKLMAFELGTFQAPLLIKKIEEKLKNFSAWIEKDVSGKLRFLLARCR